MIDYEKIGVVDITQPKHGCKVYTNMYWNCIEDETKALFYGTTPQCNSDERIMQMVGLARDKENIEKKMGGRMKVIFVPVAYFNDKRHYD